jgi:hypothetical protein
VIEVIREEIKKFLDTNENENPTYQNLWETEKAMLSGKFIAISAYIKKMRDLLNKQSNDASYTTGISLPGDQRNHCENTINLQINELI